MNSFPPSVTEQLGYYVYLYVDPRDGEVFYVGKGKGNRAFHHLNEIGETQKTLRINAIRESNQEPRIEILAYGFEQEDEALRVEAAAIDLIGLEKLTNQKRGWNSATYGRTSIEEIVAYNACAEVEILGEHQVLLIRINQLFVPGMEALALYEATRGIWRIDRERAAHVQYVFAVYQNVVREVYEVAQWLPAGTTEYFTRTGENNPCDWENIEPYTEFVGRIAPAEVRDRYKLKSVGQCFTPGSRNSIQYVNC